MLLSFLFELKKDNINILKIFNSGLSPKIVSNIIKGLDHLLKPPKKSPDDCGVKFKTFKLIKRVVLGCFNNISGAFLFLLKVAIRIVKFLLSVKFRFSIIL